MVRSCQALGGAPAHPPPSSHPERSCTRTMRSGRGHCMSVVAHSCMREHHTIHADPRLEWRSLQAGFVHQDTSGAPLPPPPNKTHAHAPSCPAYRPPTLRDAVLPHVCQMRWRSIGTELCARGIASPPCWSFSILAKIVRNRSLERLMIQRIHTHRRPSDRTDNI